MSRPSSAGASISRALSKRPCSALGRSSGPSRSSQFRSDGAAPSRLRPAAPAPRYGVVRSGPDLEAIRPDRSNTLRRPFGTTSASARLRGNDGVNHAQVPCRSSGRARCHDPCRRTGVRCRYRHTHRR
ncbi:hypothetical protein VW35_01900 [Devosia soli]|uniref:Uncharacterized protein n=1 Tax=Devosia soli TaxID=361041 RepID=A0A0F5LH99_9HYPH|nr:hypothetical protein VW35_01900 [Devosia soli]